MMHRPVSFHRRIPTSGRVTSGFCPVDQSFILLDGKPQTNWLKTCNYDDLLEEARSLQARLHGNR
jgi:hypothetical protein